MNDIEVCGTSSAGLVRRFQHVRAATETLAIGLTDEDQCVQSMPDASPAKWHRAHTTWFFEQFVLVPHAPGYQVFDPAFCFLFNSYYEAVGPRHPRPFRGLLTRPSVARVTQYRRHVDAAHGVGLVTLAGRVDANRDLTQDGMPLVGHGSLPRCGVRRSFRAVRTTGQYRAS